MLSEEEKQAINRLKLLNRELYIDNCSLVNVNDFSTVLNLIAKLQKENEELKQENRRIKFFSNNLFIDDYIPKIEIKDLMEKLNKEIRNCDTIEAVFKIKQQQILQELLESSDINE